MNISKKVSRDRFWYLVQLHLWGISLWDNIDTGGGFKNHNKEGKAERGFNMDEWIIDFSKRKQKTNARI